MNNILSFQILRSLVLKQSLLHGMDRARQISADVTALVRDEYARADVDKDGSLSTAEIITHIQAR